MCGIIGRIGSGNAVNELVAGLENLEYRGYDSAGLAVKNGTGPSVIKQQGEISELKNSLLDDIPDGNIGIGHTRWSTHGPPTDENSHPHTDCTGDVAVVHNGVINNYDDLRAELKADGHGFDSDTDTEVVPHLVETYLDDGHDAETAFRKTIDRLEGSYAIAMIVEGTDAIFATRQDSPLVLGIDREEYYLASDVPAFLEYTENVVYFEDGDVAVLRPDGVKMTDLEGNAVSRTIETVDWDSEETGKGEYEHYMRKEIDEQPNALSNTLQGRVDPDAGEISLPEVPADLLDGVDQVQFLACGTSYHASMYGVQLLTNQGIPASAFRASEYLVSGAPVTEDTLVVAVTQSGETADTLGALREAQRRGARTLTVTNVVGSTAAREADEALFIRAGPEIGVAATKTFTSQAVTLVMLTDRITRAVQGRPSHDDMAAFTRALADLPDHVEELLETSTADRLVDRHIDDESYFFIGRGPGYPVALEGALKFKEITYEHAEGFASGELKHGPLALVTDRTPVFAVFTGEDDEKTLTNAIEAQARGADIVAVAGDRHDVEGVVDERLAVPETHPALEGLLANVQLQLVSYHMADQLGRSIDKPRNLAKSVTVE